MYHSTVDIARRGFLKNETTRRRNGGSDCAEYGPAEVLRRLSDPVWFQTFGSVLGFDWHSSAYHRRLWCIKEGLGKGQGELGIFFAGGKGKASRKTPQEIAEAGENTAYPTIWLPCSEPAA